MQKFKANRVISLILSILMLMSFVPNMAMATDNMTVTVKVENTTFLTQVNGVSPDWTGTKLDYQVTVPSGSTIMEATVKAFAENSIVEQGSPDNYIYEIDGLAAFEGGYMSGWMITLNDWFISEGAGNFTVEDGDIINWMYTSEGLGADLGGTFDNNDTSLKALGTSVGTLSPKFASGTLAYTLTVPVGTTGVIVTPTAANKNFQVRINVGGTVYKRTQAVPVADGTVIKVGCGDPSWPSMNMGSVLTEYTITVAVEQQQTELDSVDVYLNYFNLATSSDSSKQAFPRRKVTLDAGFAAGYGYSSEHLTLNSDKVTLYDALVKIVEGSDSNFAGNPPYRVNIAQDGTLTQCFQNALPRSGYSLFIVVNGVVVDINKTDQILLSDNDEVFVLWGQSTYHTLYSWFEHNGARVPDVITINKDETIELTLKGSGVSEAFAETPLSGVAIGTVTKNTSQAGTFTQIGSLVTDSGGKASVSFDKAGTYAVSASGNTPVNGKDFVVPMPRALIIVKDDSDVSVTNVNTIPTGDTSSYQYKAEYFVPESDILVLTGYQSFTRWVYLTGEVPVGAAVKVDGTPVAVDELGYFNAEQKNVPDASVSGYGLHTIEVTSADGQNTKAYHLLILYGANAEKTFPNFKNPVDSTGKDIGAEMYFQQYDFTTTGGGLNRTISDGDIKIYGKQFGTSTMLVTNTVSSIYMSGEMKDVQITAVRTRKLNNDATLTGYQNGTVESDQKKFRTGEISLDKGLNIVLFESKLAGSAPWTPHGILCIYREKTENSSNVTTLTPADLSFESATGETVTPIADANDNKLWHISLPEGNTQNKILTKLLSKPEGTTVTIDGTAATVDYVKTSNLSVAVADLYKTYTQDIKVTVTAANNIGSTTYTFRVSRAAIAPTSNNATQLYQINAQPLNASGSNVANTYLRAPDAANPSMPGGVTTGFTADISAKDTWFVSAALPARESFQMQIASVRINPVPMFKEAGATFTVIVNGTNTLADNVSAQQLIIPHSGGYTYLDKNTTLIEVIVHAPAGVEAADKTYTFIVPKIASADASFTNVEFKPATADRFLSGEGVLASGTDGKVFFDTVYSYNTVVNFKMDKIALLPKTLYADTIVSWKLGDGEFITLNPTDKWAIIPLSVGNNVVTLKGYAPGNEAGAKTYTFNILRQADVTLKSVSYGEGVSQAGMFRATRLSLIGIADQGVTSFTASFTANDPANKVEVYQNGSLVTSGTGSATATLSAASKTDRESTRIKVYNDADPTFAYEYMLTIRYRATNAPDRVYAIMPAPGQFVNEQSQTVTGTATGFGWGEGWDTCIYATSDDIGGSASGQPGISLGAFGGYVVYQFDSPISNSANHSYGTDFQVVGNAFPGNNEPAQVYVAQDLDSDGMPDTDSNGNEIWYALAGSEHYEDATQWSYEATYTNPNPSFTPNLCEDIPWTDNFGGSGVVKRNGFHEQAYYPNAANYMFAGNHASYHAGAMTYKGVNINTRSVLFGYADTVSGIGGVTVTGNPYKNSPTYFDIDWAVDQSGIPVKLGGISFIKVVTAVLMDGGSVGEYSPEVLSVARVTSKPNPVGRTSMPANITLSSAGMDDITVALSEGKTAYDIYTGDMQFVYVTVNSAEGSSIFINNQKVAAGQTAPIAYSVSGGATRQIRIIVQDGEKEPYICLLNLSNTAPEPEPIGTASVSVKNTTYEDHSSYGTPLVDRITADIYEGDTACTLLERVLDSEGISYTGNLGSFNEIVTGCSVDGLGITDMLGFSGWRIYLNGWFATPASLGEAVADLDDIELLYSNDMGQDLGGWMAWSPSCGDTAVKSLELSAGTLIPAFDKNIFSYTLEVPEGVESISIKPTAFNNFFQVRTSIGGVEYHRNAAVPVSDGTVIKVVCGDPSWPSQNNADWGLNLGLTEYTITVGAAEPEPELLEPIDVKVRVEGYDKTHTTYTNVHVTNFDFSDYGLNITGVAEGTITPLHALIQLLSDEGYNIDNATIKLTSSGMITAIFGEGDSYRSWMYSVNNEMPTGSNGPVTQFELKDGDSIAFFCVDWMYGYQSWFDKEEAEITAGDSLALTLSGINLMNWMFYEDDTVEAIGGAELYVTDGTNMVNADRATGVMTDADGKASLTFDIPGTYLISASRLSEDDDEIIDITRPYCKVIVYPEEEEPVTLPELPTEWANFRGNAQNMGVTNKATAKTASKAELLWANKFTGTFVTPNIPCIVDGNLIFSAGANIYKVNKQTGELIVSKPMAAAPSFGICPITYGGGMVFAQISNGRIQAFNADTLESLWISEPMGGQSLSPIVYSDGYVYTGFWTGETADNSYVCLSVTDEDPNNKTEVKNVKWKHTVTGGFYWAGGVVLDDYIIFGSDDGNGGASSPSKLYSLNRITGAVKDTLDIIGDQRSTIAYNEADGCIYFTTKAGYLYSVKYTAGGTFDKANVKSKVMQSGWQATGTPVVYKGRLYIGIGQGFDNGKLIVANTDTLETIYEVPLNGYPQGSALLSNAYEEETGKVYVYIAYNKTPGGLTVIEDSAGQTTAVSSELFTPTGGQTQYCLGSPICDNDGTIYYHNDSATIFAIANKPGEPEDPEKLLTSVRLERSGTNIAFTSTGEHSYSATVANSYSSVDVIPSTISGATVKVNDQDLIQNKANISLSVGANTIIVTVTKGSVTETTTIEVTRNSSSGGSTGGNEIPGFGKVVGKVNVSMKNNTFPGGDFTGNIFTESSFDFAENDTMMTIVLRALAKHGYGWTGQGGTVDNGVNDYAIAYLASITKGGKALGEFSGDPGSGWMGTLNDWFVNEGFQQFKPVNGDEISVEFTQNLGVDIGGAWGDPDTSLRSLSASKGTLSPAFSSGISDYTLTLPSGTSSVTLKRSAKNRNYLVKTFKNEKVTSKTEGSSFYRYNASIPVKNGDIIYIGVGEPAWPSMNNQGSEATSYTATWYKVEIKIGDSTGGTTTGGTGGVSVTSTPTPTPTLTPDVPSSWHNPYTDVATTDWFYSAIKYVTENGLMQGVGNGEFSPGADVTRAMLVTMLYRYEKASVVNSENPFTDVENGQWYTDAVIWAAGNGIVEGYGEGIFAPNDRLTREQIVTILYRYAIKKGLDVSHSPDLSAYTDTDEISDWGLAAVQWANAAGILKGRTDSTLVPGGTANRAEVATLLMRFVEEILVK